MNPSVSLQRIVLILGIPLTVITILFSLVNSSAFVSKASELSLAITIDLVVLLPLVHFLLVRKTSIPSISVVPVFIVSMLVGFQILPETQQNTLVFFSTWILPLVEITVFTYIIIKVKRFTAQFRDGAEDDFYNRFRAVARQELPLVAATLLATEISVIYYGFLAWRKRRLEANEFSYHENNGTPAMLFALILIVGVEVFAMHLWISQYSSIIAWVLSILSVYSGLQLFGFAKSLYRRPYVLKELSLNLRYGILAEAVIPFENIKSINPSEQNFEFTNLERTLSPLGKLDTHNLVIEFVEPQEITQLYGIKKNVSKLFIHVDKPVLFQETVIGKLP